MKKKATRKPCEDFSKLPQDYKLIIQKLEAYEVVLLNKTERNDECLIKFYNKQDRIFLPELKYDLSLAAISAALELNKTADVRRLLDVAKKELDTKTYTWIEKWSKGEMWIKQVNGYINKSTFASGDLDKSE